MIHIKQGSPMGKKRKTTKKVQANVDHILWNELIDRRDSPARKKRANKTSGHWPHETISHPKTKLYCVMLLKYQDDKRYREEAADLAQTLLSHCHQHDLDRAINVILRVGARNHTLVKLVRYYDEKQKLTTIKTDQIQRDIQNYSRETSSIKRRNIELKLLMSDPDHRILQEIIADRNCYVSLFNLFKKRLLSHDKVDIVRMLSISRLLMKPTLKPHIKLMVEIFQHNLISIQDNEPTSNTVFRDMIHAVEHPVVLKNHKVPSAIETLAKNLELTLPSYMKPSLDLRYTQNQPTACSDGEKQSNRLVQIYRGLSSSIVAKKTICSHSETVNAITYPPIGQKEEQVHAQQKHHQDVTESSANELLHRTHGRSYIAALRSMSLYLKRQKRNCFFALHEGDIIIDQYTYHAALLSAIRCRSNTAPASITSTLPGHHFSKYEGPAGFCVFDTRRMYIQYALEKKETPALIDLDVNEGEPVLEDKHGIHIDIFDPHVYPHTKDNPWNSKMEAPHKVNVLLTPRKKEITTGRDIIKIVTTYLFTHLATIKNTCTIIISLGFDSHRNETAFHCEEAIRFTSDDFKLFYSEIKKLYDTRKKKQLRTKIHYIIEGGYNLKTLPELCKDLGNHVNSFYCRTQPSQPGL